jgi:hypothetical protein
MKFVWSIIELTKTGLIEVNRVYTPEEAYHMVKKWQDIKPSSKFDFLCYEIEE